MFQSIDRHGFERATLHDVLEDSPQRFPLYLGEMIEERGSTDFWRFWVVQLWVEDLAVQMRPCKKEAASTRDRSKDCCHYCSEARSQSSFIQLAPHFTVVDIWGEFDTEGYADP
jgi:hypothetical protein